jgi:hypothetical protein
MNDSVLDGIGGPLDCVRINPRRHIMAAMNTEPLDLPPMLDAALMDASTIDSVADDLCTLFNLMTRATHNGGYTYAVHSTHLDIGGCGYSVDIFYRTNGYHTGDPFWVTDSFIVVDLHRVYQLEDNATPGDCGLFETTVGLWVAPARDTGSQPELDWLNDRLSAGYSHYPYGELEANLDSPITYHKGRYLCRIKGVPYLCTVEPIEPHYGG